MRKVTKLGILALCLVMVGSALAACSSVEAVAGADLSFKTLVKEPTAEDTWETRASASESGKALVVTVPSGSCGIELNLNKFIEKNEGYLGKKFSFTRSDMPGRKFYAYEENAEGTHWAKIGTSSAVAKADRPHGHLYVRKEAGNINLYVFASRDLVTGKEDITKAFNQVKTIVFEFSGHNKKSHKLEIKIKTAGVESRAEMISRIIASSKIATKPAPTNA